MPLSYGRTRTVAQDRVVQTPARPDRPAADAGFGREKLIGLQDKLEGRIVMPSYPHYSADRQWSNPLFQSDPQVIVHCETETDVQYPVLASRKIGLNARRQSGGNSTAELSAGPGITFDTSSLPGCQVDPSDPDASAKAQDARLGC